MVSLKLTWSLNINGWTFEDEVFLFESRDLFFSGAKWRNYVVVFLGVQSSKKILFFQWLHRAETSYGPEWWAKDRSQGGEKRGGGGGMNHQAVQKSPCMVWYQPSNHSVITVSNESRRGWSFKPKSGWSLGVLAWRGEFWEIRCWLLQIPRGSMCSMFFLQVPGTASHGRDFRYIQRDIGCHTKNQQNSCTWTFQRVPKGCQFTIP